MNIGSLPKMTSFPCNSCNRLQPVPMLCIAGFSGSGKTTVTFGIVEALKQLGLSVGTIKHDVHGFEMDMPGKDSWRHKKAGASVTVITSPSQIGMVMDADHDHLPFELLPLFSSMDIVLVEGFKRSDLPKIEIFRLENGKPSACKDDPNLIAVVSDVVLDWNVPWYSIDDIQGLSEFIMQYFNFGHFKQYRLYPQSETNKSKRELHGREKISI